MKIETADRTAAEKPAQPPRKKSPWETAPDFAALVAELFPKLIARAAPTAPLPGVSPKPAQPGTIEEALVKLTASGPTPVASPPVAPVAEAPAVEAVSEDAAPIDVSALPPVDEPTPELPEISVPVPVPAHVSIETAAPMPLPVVIDLPPPRPQTSTIPIAVAPPPPIAEVAPIDFDEDFMPVRDGHIGRASASITVGEGAERVNLRITADSQDVRVHAVTATPEAALQLQRGASELASSLARHGLNLANLSADSGGRGSREAPETAGDRELLEAEEIEETLIAAGVRAVI